MSVEGLQAKRIGLTEHLKLINSHEARSDVFLDGVYRALPPSAPSSVSSSAPPQAIPDMNIQLMKFLVENENTPEQAQFFNMICDINVGMQDAVNQPLPDMDEDLGGGKHKQKRRRTIKRKYRRSIAV